MANNLIAAALGSSVFRITDLLSGPIPLTGVEIKRVRISLNSKLLKNAREDGTTAVDSRIVMPYTIEVETRATTVDGAETLTRLMNSRDTMFTIQTRGLLFKNVMMMNNNNNQTPEMLSASPINLIFQQLLLQEAVQPECLQDGDSSLINLGITSVVNASKSVAQFATDWMRATF